MSASLAEKIKQDLTSIQLSKSYVINRGAIIRMLQDYLKELEK